MKLRTRLVPLASRMSADGEPNDAWHDAMAAHALLQAMGECKMNYASPALVLACVKQRAAEILAGWWGRNDGTRH
ncbi:hypothetical protein ACFWZU_15430 [Frateuria sp. GZRR33]|uniref:hypothetical protein n=1 Tax=Frateuria sp. GZRR33 TaxID=3351535 RepID=UPI003EDBAB10